MIDKKKYVISFLISSLALLVLILFFVTWMNPNRTTPAPWSIDFVSDRNMPLKKYSLIKDNQDYTDLIVGSSTSEVIVPEHIEKKFRTKSYLGGTGGSKTPLRLAQIQLALRTNPNLKRIIYVSDLFEFLNTELDAETYYQTDIMNEIPEVLRSRFVGPDWIQQIQEYISESSVKSAFKTLSDYRKFKSGKYESQYRKDGTTSRSMVQFDNGELIDLRAKRIARAYESQYKNIRELDPTIQKLYLRAVEAASERGVKITFIIPPWHPVFYKHFESDFKKNDEIYKKWVIFVRSLQSQTIQVLDYSYPQALEKGILNNSEYWNDGVHFSLKSADIMLEQVYTDR